MDVHAEITEMIIKLLAVEANEVVSEAHLQDDLGADSLALLNLAEAIAKRYEIDIDSDDLVDIENLGELLELVQSRISLKG